VEEAHGDARRPGETCDPDRALAVGRRAIAEIAVEVRAPALHRAGGHDRARVILAVRRRGGERGDAFEARDGVSGGAPVFVGRAVAEFPVVVQSPTFRATRRASYAGVVTSGGERGDRGRRRAAHTAEQEREHHANDRRTDARPAPPCASGSDSGANWANVHGPLLSGRGSETPHLEYHPVLSRRGHRTSTAYLQNRNLNPFSSCGQGSMSARS
jgi:hypothetical protein